MMYVPKICPNHLIHLEETMQMKITKATYAPSSQGGLSAQCSLQMCQKVKVHRIAKWLRL